MQTQMAPLAEYPLNLPTVEFESAEAAPAILANNLLLYMTFAYGAYWERPKSNPEEVFIGAEFLGRIANTSGALDAFVIPETQEAILAFRGSNRFTHWRSNLKANWMDHPIDGLEAGRVHRGFHEAMESLWPHCQALLTQCTKACGGSLSRVTLVGHSRGGAIAILCAPLVRHEVAPAEIQVYTFACPRVGEWKFAQAFSELGILHWRCEVLGDPVPVVGFIGQHTGHLARIEVGETTRLVLVRREESPLRRLVTTKVMPTDIMEKHTAKSYLAIVRSLIHGTPAVLEALTEL